MTLDGPMLNSYACYHISLTWSTSLLTETRASPDTSLKHVARQCQHLTLLDLIYISSLNEASFAALGQYGYQLTDLAWSISHSQSAEWLKMLTSWPLQRLHISPFYQPPNANEILAIKTLRRLTRLHIIMQPDSAKSFLLPTAWPALTHLTLTPCDAIDDPALVAFLKAYPHLEDLQLICPHQLSDTSLDAMAPWLLKLAHVKLYGKGPISPAGVRRLVRKCRLLKKLHLFGCKDVLPKHFPEAIDASYRYAWIEFDKGMLDKIRQNKA